MYSIRSQQTKWIFEKLSYPRIKKVIFFIKKTNMPVSLKKEFHFHEFSKKDFLPWHFYIIVHCTMSHPIGDFHRKIQTDGWTAASAFCSATNELPHLSNCSTCCSSQIHYMSDLEGKNPPVSFAATKIRQLRLP